MYRTTHVVIPGLMQLRKEVLVSVRRTYFDKGPLFEPLECSFSFVLLVRQRFMQLVSHFFA